VTYYLCKQAINYYKITVLYTMQDKKIFLLQNSPPISEATHSVYKPMRNGALAPGVKQPKRKAQRSPQSSAEDKNDLEQNLNSLACLHGVYRNNSTSSSPPSLAYSPYSCTASTSRMIAHADVFCCQPTSLDAYRIQITLNTA
jgi:hypothetical protein